MEKTGDIAMIVLRRKALLVVVVFLFCIQSSLVGWINHNSSEEAFEEDGTGETTVYRQTSPANEIGKLIAVSAGHFLESHSGFLAFLNKIELADVNGLNYTELDEILDRSITAMEKTVESYGSLKDRAERTPYNYDVYWKLLFFEYRSFQREKGLNPTVFSRTSYFLGYGDVRGCYGETLKKSQIILEQLKIIKRLIDSRQFPVISDLWRVNQQYSETLLFGQYVAEVFSEIKKY